MTFSLIPMPSSLTVTMNSSEVDCVDMRTLAGSPTVFTNCHHEENKTIKTRGKMNQRIGNTRLDRVSKQIGEHLHTKQHTSSRKQRRKLNGTCLTDSFRIHIQHVFFQVRIQLKIHNRHRCSISNICLDLSQTAHDERMDAHGLLLQNQFA